MYNTQNTKYVYKHELNKYIKVYEKHIEVYKAVYNKHTTNTTYTQVFKVPKIRDKVYKQVYQQV